MLRIYIGFQAIKSVVFLHHHHISVVFLHHHHHHRHHISIVSLHHHHISVVFLHHHHSSIVFPPPPPPPPPHIYCFLFFAHSFHFFFLHHRDSLKYCQLPSLVHFVAMSRVVNNNRGFLHLSADCPDQRQVPLKTATPQQLHALVQVLYNILMEHIPITTENKRILLPYKDALLNMARPNVPCKTKKRVLVQEGSGFIEGVLAPVVSSLGFLML